MCFIRTEERFLAEGIAVEAIPVWHGELEVTAFRIGASRCKSVQVGACYSRCLIFLVSTDNKKRRAKLSA